MLGGYVKFDSVIDLIIIEVKKTSFIDMCLDPLTVYMRVMHNYRKEKQNEDCYLRRGF